jgi:hypothetical protein
MNGWQGKFRRELDALLSWKDRSEKIEAGLKEKGQALAVRPQKLLALRRDFDALTLEFWKAFGRTLGCECPAQTIAGCQEKMRSPGYIATLGIIVCVTVSVCIFWRDNTPVAVLGFVIGVIGIAFMVIDPR